jgi:hypothetical protein
METHLQLVTAGSGECCQHGGIDGGPHALHRQDGRAQRVGAPAQAGGHHLFELHQRAQRTLLDATHGAGGGDLQGDGHRQRLLVVQQQRRQ